MNKDLPTDKLYLRDPYTATFQASLLSCALRADGTNDAVLDRTCFYPLSGGQLPDDGVLEGVRVLDVREEGDVVVHRLESLVPLGPVSGEISWARRFDHMQQHTGQHVLSRAFIEVAGMDTVSFHMGDESCTIDLSGTGLDDDVARRAEDLSNSIICENREVQIRTLPRDEVTQTALRKSLPDGVIDVRLVEVDKFDTIGCCGTHVRRTGELGLIKVLKFEKAKGAHRVHFKVGKRAVKDFSVKHDIVRGLANHFTTSVDTLVEKVEKIESQRRWQRKELQSVSKRLAAFEARRLLDQAVAREGLRCIAHVLPGDNEEYIRMLASELKNEEKTISLLATASGHVVCNASNDVEMDLAATVVERAKSLGGSGGGKGGFATVRLPQSVNVSEFLGDVLDSIREV